jgi:uncharacterized phage protein (predicted DNA packaging)
MKVSEIKLSDLLKQCRLEADYLAEGETEYLENLKKAAIEYVKSFTGLSLAQLEEHEDITIAVLVLVSDMYDNRQVYVDRNNTNRTVDTILNMYRVNFL